ncbi:hypothetical protein LXA43DRAFT_898749 [Ganoderma leucocontextum]|nr:hypothetical protein LXA43DRAFT_898749 [Ganoderma leucocontextum]
MATTDQAAEDHRSSSHRFTLRGRAVISGVILALLLVGATFGWLSWSSRPAVDDIPPAVKAHIDRVIDRTVNRAFRDLIGRRDFALLADGGILLPELTEVTSNRNFFRSRERGLHPEAALDDDLRIGNCWSIPGAAGQLGLRLSTMIHPTHISIDHIPLEIAADISRAPREIALWGGIDGPYRAVVHNLTRSDNVTPPAVRGRSRPPSTHGYDFPLLAHFEYDIRAPAHVQTFPLQQYIVDSEMVFGVVVLEILSNWGGESTCLYRVRVHGDVADVVF